MARHGDDDQRDSAMTRTGHDVSATAVWLVLDVDDTLVATYRTGYAKCVAAAHSLRLEPPSEASFAQLYGHLEFGDCIRRLHPGADITRYHAAYDALADRIPPVPLCDGHAVMEAAARTGLRCAVLTNGPHIKTIRKLHACGMDANAFDFVITGDTAAVRKPDIEAFRSLSAHGVVPGRAWYVSDSAAEWRAAESAGLRAVGIVTGRSSSQGFFPTLQLCDAEVLPEVIPILRATTGAPRPGSPAAVTFDAGFTLIKPFLQPAGIIRRCLTRAGAVPPESAIRAALDAASDQLAAPERWWTSAPRAESTLHRFYENVLAHLGCPSPDSAREIVRAYTDVSNWLAVPGARDLLAAAQASGRRVGVLSNWQPSLHEILAATGLGRHVDAVIPSTLAGAAKPSPAAFLAAADALGVAVSQLIHVGDGLVDDVFGALRAGCRAVLVDSLPGTAAGTLADSFLLAPAQADPEEEEC